MKIDKYVNKALRFLLPKSVTDGETRFWSQNLNEDANGEPKGLPHHGRASMYVLGERLFRVEWSVRFIQNLFSIGAQADGEDGSLALHCGLFPVTLYWSVPVPFEFWKKYRYSDRNFFDLHLTNPIDDDYKGEMTLRWQFGGSKMEWSSKTPKWKDGHFSLTDFVFGKREYTEGEPDLYKVQIPMPEGPYEATVELRNDTWKRARSSAHVIRRAHITVPVGIPFPGKGESEWDCGEDACYGLTCPAATVEEAIAAMVRTVFRSRRKYGSLMTEYPHPSTRTVPRVVSGGGEDSPKAEA